MISDTIIEMRERTRNGYFKKYRKTDIDFDALQAIALKETSAYKTSASYFTGILALETPVVFPGERLHFTRTVGLEIPKIDWEGGYRRPMENLSPNYALLLQEGLEGRLRVIEERLPQAPEGSEKRDLYETSRQEMLAVIDLAEKYADAAEKTGDSVSAALMRTVPRKPASTLCEALQSIYFMSSMLRLTDSLHIGFGRMDQYLWSFYRDDLATGRETEQSAHDLIAEFFLKLNRDSDLFVGLQPGDNGQSVMVGGCTRDGENAENPLTKVLLDVSADLAVIDPKLNLRITKDTSEEVLLAAARLAGCGLGFPQYNNDDQIIPGLVKFGYPLEDARDYTVAACWEYVIPGGRDIPNIWGMNMPRIADMAIRKGLKSGEDFEAIKTEIKRYMKQWCQDSVTETLDLKFCPNPLFAALCRAALEKGEDYNMTGGGHRHFGCHGCGSSTAADSLAAVKHFVFDEKSVTREELLEALETNYEHAEPLRQKLRTEGPHVGCNSPLANECLKFIFDAFAEALESVESNGFGGRVRPGTGSAMNYVVMVEAENPKRVKATADGRKDLEFISSSLAPAPGVMADGILSVFESYGKLDYTRLCNGGPITMEVAPDYFQSPSALKKTAGILRAFYKSGCQQLQLNVLNKDLLRHAQKYPEQHRDLVVRVWGWSGYFVELSKPYQEQIIGRQAFRG